MRQRLIVIGVILAALACGGAWLWSQRAEAPLQSSDIAREALAMDGSEVDDLSVKSKLAFGESAAPSRKSPLELPPADTPLAESFAALEAEARRGNAVAACRLGAELSRCKVVRSLEILARNDAWAAEAVVATGSEKLMAQKIDEIALRNETIARAARQCANVEQLTSQPLARYFAIAARQGHVPSIIEYLSGRHLGPTSLMRDPALIPEFQRDARGLFQQALTSADERLLRLWIIAVHDPDNMALSDIIPAEWRTRGFMHALIQQLPAEVLISRLPGVRLAPGNQIPVSDAERAAAESVYADHFANLTPRPKQDAPNDGLDDWRDDLSLERYRCDEAGAAKP